MDAQKHQAGFLTLWTALVGTLGLMLLCIARPEAVIVLGLLAWFAVALPYALVVSLVRVATRTSRPKRTAAGVRAAKEAKAPTRAEMVRKAGQELQADLAAIDALVMEEDEKDLLRARAQMAYEEAISPYIR